ncbi:MAG: SLBB domain-containing protein [Ignavibacteria bacterium]|nr:SLBB domain-containing protein [Ignavibacteria bacterium]
MIKKLLILLLICSGFTKAQILDNNLKNNSLLSNTTISVTVGGTFPFKGTFPALMTERVDEFITRLYNEAVDLTLRTTNDPELYRKAKEQVSRFSLRGIKLKRMSGEELIIDLQKFRLNGNFENNPYLKNDDVIIFPPYDISTNFISVSGVVHSPNWFYYIEGDRLSDMIELAGGVNPAYENVDSVEIIRLSYDGLNQTSFKVGINDDIVLQRGDQLRIKALETHKRNFQVLILGEVNSPGNIPITKNSTRIYDVIKAAGGFTEQASFRRAKLYTGNSLAIFLEKQYGINLAEQPDFENVQFRNTIVNLEAMLMFRMSNVYPDDSTYFFMENQLRVLTEGSSLDFTKINDPESDIANYIVKTGDVIIIPEIRNSVYVFGQVARPGHVNFVDGKNYEYYLNEAGGMGGLAEEEDLMVIKGGSRTWISPLIDEVKIEEGDYIYVPKQSLRSFRNYAAEYAIYVGMLASIATVILLLITAFK